MGCWSIHTIQKQNTFDGKMQQPCILCLGLAKCDSACGRMGIAYVFDQAIEQVCGVMEIPMVQKFDSEMQ